MAYNPVYRKRMERKRAAACRRCAVMRSAKARRRREAVASWRDVGGFVSDGVLGAHEVRLLCREDYPALAVVVDGRARRPRSLRGVVRCLARMVWDGYGKSLNMEGL